MSPQSTAKPERSLAQRLDALAKANCVRTRRAEYKRDLKAGRVSLIDDLLGPPPDFLATARVFELLTAMPKHGKIKANNILVECRISHVKTMAGLSQRQRHELITIIKRRL